MIDFRWVNKWFGSLHVFKDVVPSVKEGEVFLACVIALQASLPW